MNHDCLCSYLPLAKQIGLERSVFVLDDGIVESGDFSFPFQSIEEVATECMEVVESLAKTYFQEYSSPISAPSAKKNEILLAGWSYGGVVAVELAKLLTTKSTSLIVANIVLFDSPLRSPVVQEKKQSSEEHQPVKTKVSSSISPITTHQAEQQQQQQVQVHEVAEKHFDACTRLLSLYHQRPAETQMLQCAICDIRPTQSDYLINFDAIEELTSNPQSKRVVVNGSHWTMLTDEFISEIVTATTQFWTEMNSNNQSI
jgi:thioesterase domain-containing protein